MDSFFDTTVIIKTLEYTYIKEELRKKCSECVKLSEKRLISFIVKEELERVIIKRKEIYENVIKKINNSSFQIDYKKSSFLNKEDQLFAENMYLKVKSKNLTELKKEFDSEINFLNYSLIVFIKEKINEILITKSELDKSIVLIINEFIKDFADCKVLASAIQIQQNKQQFVFASADRHFDPNGYNYLENEEPRLEKYLFPKLKNLLYED